MRDLRNRVQLIGNLGMNPEIVNFENGKKLAKFSVATSQNYNNSNGEKVTDTQWHNIVAWGKDAELAEKFLAKGSHVIIEGKIIYKSFEDKQGQKRYSTEIVMNDIVLPPKK